MTQHQKPKTPQGAWQQAYDAAANTVKHGIIEQLTAIKDDGHIPPDDADPEIRELFIDTMVALKAAAAG